MSSRLATRSSRMARAAAQRTAHKLFLAGDRVGVHVLPSHYYTPVASRRELRRSEDEWRRPLAAPGFDWDTDAQAQWVMETAADYPAEMPIATILKRSEEVGGFRYGPIEAQFLYSVIRKTTPGRIVEIGSGSSTQVMSAAVQRSIADGGPASQIVAFDPYTAGWVDGLPHVEAHAIGGMALDQERLGLTPGDLLFIDSTHSVRTGSELAHIYLELLPTLPAGITIHIHDIFLPYLYGPHLYSTLFDWQETTLVAALLTGNPRLRIKAALSGVFHDRPDALHRAFPEFRPRQVERGLHLDENGHFPSSLWLETTA